MRRACPPLKCNLARTVAGQNHQSARPEMNRSDLLLRLYVCLPPCHVFSAFSHSRASGLWQHHTVGLAPPSRESRGFACVHVVFEHDDIGNNIVVMISFGDGSTWLGDLPLSPRLNWLEVIEVEIRSREPEHTDDPTLLIITVSGSH